MTQTEEMRAAEIARANADLVKQAQEKSIIQMSDTFAQSMSTDSGFKNLMILIKSQLDMAVGEVKRVRQAPVSKIIAEGKVWEMKIVELETKAKVLSDIYGIPENYAKETARLTGNSKSPNSNGVNKSEVLGGKI